MAINAPTASPGPVIFGIDFSGPMAALLVGVVGLLIFAPRGGRLEGFGEHRTAARDKAGRRRALGSAARKAIARAETRGEDDIADRISRGEIRGDQLRELMGSGRLKLRNPITAESAKRVAMEMSEKEHGTPYEVIRLSPEDRVLPEYVLAMGRTPKIIYEPRPSSLEKGDGSYTHEAGDRGGGEFTPERAPFLAIRPDNRRPVLVSMGSPMRLGKQGEGLVG